MFSTDDKAIAIAERVHSGLYLDTFNQNRKVAMSGGFGATSFGDRGTGKDAEVNSIDYIYISDSAIHDQTGPAIDAGETGHVVANQSHVFA